MNRATGADSALCTTDWTADMQEPINIQWFPGHMTKARRMIAEELKLVDAVCEVIDARIPMSSRNPDMDDLIKEKPRLIVMNRADQADEAVTAEWRTFFEQNGIQVMLTDCKSGKGTDGFSNAVRRLLKERLDALAAKGQVGRKLRVMVLGIPNVGKSSLINRIAKRKSALASDKPGVTRGRQWVNIDKSLELLDTPGVLWPKFDSQTVGENLAFTGAVKDDVVEIETLGANLISRLSLQYPDRLKERYKFDSVGEESGYELLEKAAEKRGFLLRGGERDIRRMASILLDEFRGGKLGRISLERPPLTENKDGFLGDRE